MTPPLNAPAVASWFVGRLCALDAFLEQAGPNATQRRNQMLRGTARQLVLATQLDPSGAQFPIITVLLASSCRVLGIAPSVADWQKALIDGAGAQAGSLIPFAALGIDLVSQFRDWATHALIAAGVVPGVDSDVPVAERRTMHELAVAYLMRLLVAYADRFDDATEPSLVNFRYAMFAP